MATLHIFKGATFKSSVSQKSLLINKGYRETSQKQNRVYLKINI